MHAEDRHLAGGRLGQAEDEVDGGRLTRAVGPEDRHDFSRGDAHVDIPDRLDLPEVLSDPLQLDGQRRHGLENGQPLTCPVCHGVSLAGEGTQRTTA
jgi:hypothetical protein